MQLKLSDLEIEILRKLANGEAVALSPNSGSAWNWRAWSERGQTVSS